MYWSHCRRTIDHVTNQTLKLIVGSKNMRIHGEAVEALDETGALIYRVHIET
jgi:hypothetical protein